MNNPKVSIIIPVYNAACYLHQCIESIINQSYLNIELILVNDGSTDESNEICFCYASKDSRIIVIDIPNGGASHARNVGLDKASGELIWFVDSDDWVDVKALESLVAEMTDDILFFGFNKIYKDYHVTCQISPKQWYNITDIDECLAKLFCSKNQYLGFTWNKLFKADVIKKNNLRFHEDLIIKEDEIFTLEYCMYIASIGISAATPYHYRVLGNSVSHSLSQKRNMLNLAESMDILIKHCPYNNKLKRMLINATSWYYLGAVKECLQKENTDDIIEKYIIYNRNNYNQLDLPLKRKFVLWIPNKYIRNFIIRNIEVWKLKLQKRSINNDL